RHRGFDSHRRLLAAALSRSSQDRLAAAFLFVLADRSKPARSASVNSPCRLGWRSLFFATSSYASADFSPGVRSRRRSDGPFSRSVCFDEVRFDPAVGGSHANLIHRLPSHTGNWNLSVGRWQPSAGRVRSAEGPSG